jgi:hypothetical protein
MTQNKYRYVNKLYRFYVNLFRSGNYWPTPISYWFRSVQCCRLPVEQEILKKYIKGDAKVTRTSAFKMLPIVSDEFGPTCACICRARTWSIQMSALYTVTLMLLMGLYWHVSPALFVYKKFEYIQHSSDWCICYIPFTRLWKCIFLFPI